MRSKGPGMGATSKMGGMILLLALLFSMLGCVMEWIQVDYTEPTFLWARKNWTTVAGATGADWEAEIQPTQTSGPDTGNQGYMSGQTEGAQPNTGTLNTLKPGEFPVYSDGHFAAGSQIGMTDANGPNIPVADRATASMEVDSSLWKYCKDATGGSQAYSSTNTTITQPLMTVSCQVVADMEGDGDLKQRLQAAQAFSLLAIAIGIVALFAAFSPKGKCCGAIPSSILSIMAAVCAIIAVGTVSCASQTMEDDGNCVFPYHNLRDDSYAHEYPGVGVICEVFAIIFFLIGGLVNYVGNKLDSSARHSGDPGKF